MVRTIPRTQTQPQAMSHGCVVIRQNSHEICLGIALAEQGNFALPRPTCLPSPFLLLLSVVVSARLSSRRRKYCCHYGGQKNGLHVTGRRPRVGVLDQTIKTTPYFYQTNLRTEMHCLGQVILILDPY